MFLKKTSTCLGFVILVWNESVTTQYMQTIQFKGYKIWCFFFLWTKAKVVKVLISRKRITERSKKAISVIKCINLTKEAVKVSGVFYSYDRKIELEKKVSKSPTWLRKSFDNLVIKKSYFWRENNYFQNFIVVKRSILSSTTTSS